MADLKCGVTNCGYNKDSCCCKGDICVGGERAENADSTCCESFTDGKKTSYNRVVKNQDNLLEFEKEFEADVVDKNLVPKKLISR